MLNLILIKTFPNYFLFFLISIKKTYNGFLSLLRIVVKYVRKSRRVGVLLISPIYPCLSATNGRGSQAVSVAHTSLLNLELALTSFKNFIVSPYKSISALRQYKGTWKWIPLGLVNSIVNIKTATGFSNGGLFRTYSKLVKAKSNYYTLSIANHYNKSSKLSTAI